MKVLDFAQEVFTSNTLLNETNYNDFDRSFKKSYQDSTTQSNTESSKIGKNYSCKQNQSIKDKTNSIDVKNFNVHQQNKRNLDDTIEYNLQKREALVDSKVIPRNFTTFFYFKVIVRITFKIVI